MVILERFPGVSVMMFQSGRNTETAELEGPNCAGVGNTWKYGSIPLLYYVSVALLLNCNVFIVATVVLKMSACAQRLLKY